MTITVKAAVAQGKNLPLSVEEVQLRAPGEHEVLVQMKASGLCHTDLSVIEGKFPRPMPIILGHEGAGVVLECGPGVDNVRPGDHIIINNMPHCGHCAPCRSEVTNYCADIALQSAKPSAFTWNGAPVATMGHAATFASHSVLPSNQLTVIPNDMPFDVAALVACGVMTGVGAVLFNAKVRSDTTVVVFGIGSIGLNVLQAARLAGAARIIAVDTSAMKENVARLFGATDFVNPKAVDGPVDQHIKAMLGGPADYAFECVGNVELVLDLVNPFWGVCLAVGVPPFDQQITLPATSFYFGRSLRGTFIGDGNPLTDTPKVLQWYREGKLRLDELVSHRMPLEDINHGFDLMRCGESIRSVVLF
jgi:S-(hydroxymethyl)glutathione dehydrogenase/alcohol dehydrogenase